MNLFPAVDIKDGQCVRLKQGQADEVTVFSTDPVEVAVYWVSLGARWLHIVDLDGAFSGTPRNFDLIREICSQVGVPVQLGGGIRDEQTASAYFEAGVERLIIGTMALEEENSFAALCAKYPGRIGVSLDADNNKLKSKGWVEDSGKSVFDVLLRLEDLGAAFVVYTDISRDGMQSGVNIQAVSNVVQGTALPVLVAGGVSTLQDIKDLYPLRKEGLSGIITGKAIYTKSLDLHEALDWIQSQGDLES
jgi:phosphoribosylformimino-5-aminoimidazole carboxamide ribotide isomerase